MGDLFAPSHMVVLLLIILVFFGGKKIPELMRGLGRGIREFNDAKNNVKREIEEGMNEPSKQINSTQTQQNSNQPTTNTGNN